MSINKVRIEDDAGNIFHPHTTTDVVFRPDGSSLESALTTYKDILNLSATPAGVISWSLPLATDQTRTSIVLCRANKDISNFDYDTCLADTSVTKNTLGKDAVTNTYTGLSNNTQYWVKAFISYVIGGKQYFSNGVTVTFTYLGIFDYYNYGNENIPLTGGWISWQNVPEGSQSKQSDHLFMQMINPSINGGGRGYATANKVNFTNLKTIKIEWETIQPSNRTAYFQIQSVNTGSSPFVSRITHDGPFSKLTETLDVTSLIGEYYIFIYTGATLNTSNTLKVYRVWGES